MNFSLSEEHLMVREAARDFAQTELRPGVIKRDELQEFPDNLVKKMGALGFMGIMVDPKYGGSGMDTISYVLIMEELSKVDASASVIVSVNNSLVCYGIETYPIIFGHDEFPRANSSIESLSGLRAVFKKEGSVTAGNSSGLNDGAAALLIASENAVRVNSMTPLARIVSAAVAGVEPRIMGIGPVYASQKALKQAGLTLDDMDVIEMNEAFSAQVLSCSRELGLDDKDSRINPNGGAIALGHPLGMSGTRILLTAARQLKRNIRTSKGSLRGICSSPTPSTKK